LYAERGFDSIDSHPESQQGEVMKTSAILKSVTFSLVLGGSVLLLGGCAGGGLGADPLAPPGATGFENAQREWRYAAFDWSQAIDDFDRDVTMNRPSSKLTRWNVRQGD
jgi:hypothetical protein